MKIAGLPAHIKELDGLRGLAALLVLMHHYFTGLFGFELRGAAHAADSIVGTLFVSGVDLFFVLSGFLVGGIIIDNHRAVNFWPVFVIRRVCRIFPTYFPLMASFVLGVTFLSGEDSSTSGCSPTRCRSGRT